MDPEMIRSRSAHYADPLDVLWLTCAQRLGMRVVRSREVFASWDGAGTLTLSDAADFDPDDSLTQLIFHEICHALVEGPEAFHKEDWGLCNQSDRDLGREHACHRLQASLLRPHGLRWVFAPTTDHRPFYDALPEDPLAGSSPCAALAREAHARATTGPWAQVLRDTLAATAQIVHAARPFAPADSLYAKAQPPEG